MRLPDFDMEMDLRGHVVPTPDGEIQLLPCSVTQEIERRTGIVFDRFCLSYDLYKAPDALVCWYTAFGNDEPYIYWISISDSERQHLSEL